MTSLPRRECELRELRIILQCGRDAVRACERISLDCEPRGNAVRDWVLRLTEHCQRVLVTSELIVSVLESDPELRRREDA